MGPGPCSRPGWDPNAWKQRETEGEETFRALARERDRETEREGGMEGGREGGRVWASLSLYYMVVNRGFMTRPAVINIHRHLVTRLVVRRIADVR